MVTMGLLTQVNAVQCVQTDISTRLKLIAGSIPQRPRQTLAAGAQMAATWSSDAES